MQPGTTYHYVRSHGLGNDYLVIEAALLPSGVVLHPPTVQLICDRHYGVGSDGILELQPSATADRFKLRIWNPDGSIAEKSGNGLRIFAKYLRDHGHTSADQFIIALPHDEAAVSVNSDPATGLVTLITVDIGVPTVAPPCQLTVGAESFDSSVVSVGNPHCVIIVPEVDTIDLPRLGPLIEHHALFPNRTNVQFATPVNDQLIRAIVWERGAGVTLASGSSASAVAAACYQRGLCGQHVTVAMPGGVLQVHIGADQRLTLSGPAEEICQGYFSPDLLIRLRTLSRTTTE